jgi:hypothetical protein
MSQLQVNRINDASGGVFAPISSVFRNRIINGAMVIDQRNAGASITPTNGQFSVDRWTCALTQASKFSIQQDAGAVTPPVGFTDYLGVTSLSAYSVVSGDLFFIRQAIEGFNTSDLGWGTANAKTITLSFWVRSSLTGTFGGSLNNSAQNRSYPFTYTINAANTWEYETITIAGDTSGTWLTNNGVGIYLQLSLGTGSTYSGTAGSWSGSTFYSATGATSVVGTNGATFYITGVQLEVGSTATSFDYRPYGTELMLCQRYFYSIAQPPFRGVVTASTGAGRCGYTHPVTMRTSPSLNATAALPIYDGAATSTVTITNNYSTISVCEVDLTGATGLTAFRPAIIYQTGSSVLQVSAEL